MENYFNYFTEIEECFRRCRGTPTLLSTLDWALVESWKEAGIPLPAVLVGVERTFEKFAKKPRRFRKVNGLAYCSQLVLEAAQEASTAQAEAGARRPADASPFTSGQILEYLNQNAQALEKAWRRAQEDRQMVLAGDLAQAVRALQELAGRVEGKGSADFEELENTLTALEEKITASLTRAAPIEMLAQFRREVERGLVDSRRRMTGAQIDALERQFLKKRLYEHFQVPRLSLFYL